jgi:hypothetical protein
MFLNDGTLGEECKDLQSRAECIGKEREEQDCTSLEEGFLSVLSVPSEALENIHCLPAVSCRLKKTEPRISDIAKLPKSCSKVRLGAPASLLKPLHRHKRTCWL